jgi:hypothetical protein
VAKQLGLFGARQAGRRESAVKPKTLSRGPYGRSGDPAKKETREAAQLRQHEEALARLGAAKKKPPPPKPTDRNVGKVFNWRELYVVPLERNKNGRTYKALQIDLGGRRAYTPRIKNVEVDTRHSVFREASLADVPDKVKTAFSEHPQFPPGVAFLDSPKEAEKSDFEKSMEAKKSQHESSRHKSPAEMVGATAPDPARKMKQSAAIQRFVQSGQKSLKEVKSGRGLKRGKRGGMYYETKGGRKVYVK